MLKLILNNIGKRRIQSVSILISVLISAAVLFAMFLLYNGVSDGIDTSEQRMGADIVVVPGEAEELLDETDLLFTGAPATIYMDRDAVGKISDIKGITGITTQFYTQTLSSACCSTGNEQRIIGYDPETDWIIKPWVDSNISDMGENDIVTGCNAGGFESGEGVLLGHKVNVAAVMEPTGTSLDSSILVHIDKARQFSEEAEGYGHYWEKYGEPDELVSAVMIRTTPERRNAVANLIEMRGDYKCIKSSGILEEIQKQAKTVFLLMLGAALLLCFASVFQLFARFCSMAWDRKAELGLYRALGASENYLRKLILGEAVLLTGTGAVAGTAAGYGMYRTLVSMLVEQSGFPFIEPGAAVICSGGAAVIAAAVITGCIAVALPLHQAGRIDPSAAMQKTDID